MIKILVKIIAFFIYAVILYIVACNVFLFLDSMRESFIYFFLEQKESSDIISSVSNTLPENTVPSQERIRELINKSTNPRIIAVRLRLEKAEAELYLSELELDAAFKEEKFLKELLKIRLEYEKYPLRTRNIVEEELADYLGESVKKKPLRSFLQLFRNYLKEKKD